jgi:hypothetical protein
MFLLSLIVLRIIMAVDNDTTVFMLGTNVSVMVMIFMVSFVMLMGALLLRYGNKMRVFLFFIWIAFCMSFSRIADAMSGDSNGLLDGVFFKIGHYFTTSNSILIISEIIILSVLFMGISSRLLMKQQVT